MFAISVFTCGGEAIRVGLWLIYVIRVLYTLKVCVLSSLFCHILFFFFLLWLCFGGGVRTCVCFIVAIDVYINLDEQIEYIVAKALTSGVVLDKSCCTL